MHGATLLLHDASSQITLEERVQTLHEKATRDPLTKVANRAEFDRGHDQFVETHLERGLPCALIICDIDHFKSVNDTFGHQAGDDALVVLRALLQRSCRPGDLVARYGGEEFVMLCADCDNSTATDRATTIRRELAETPQPLIGGRPITASFGVTEIQAGDTPETMLRRADRARYRRRSVGAIASFNSELASPAIPDGAKVELVSLVPTRPAAATAPTEPYYGRPAATDGRQTAWLRFRSPRRSRGGRRRCRHATHRSSLSRR